MEHQCKNCQKPLTVYRARLCDECRELRRIELNEYGRKYRKTHEPKPRSDEYKADQALKRKIKYHNDPEFRKDVKATNSQYAKGHRQQINENRRTRYANDEEFRQRLLSSDWAKRNPEKAKMIVDNWRASHPEQVTASRINYRAKKYNSGEILDSDISRLYIWQQGKCFYSGETLDQSTVEHIIAINIGGQNTVSNIALVNGSYNYSKQDKLWGLEWNPKSVDFSSLHYICRKSMKELSQELCLEIGQDWIIGINGFEIQILSSFYWSIFGGLPSGNRIYFWDWEWWGKRDAVLNVLRAKTGSSDRVYARELLLDDVTWDEAKEFLFNYHLQGPRPANTWKCLRRDSGEILGIIGLTGDEIIRLCFKNSIVGGLSRLLYSLGNQKFISWCDSRLGEGKGMEKVGFIKAHQSNNTYSYVGPGGIINRLSATKQKLNERLGTTDLPEKVVAQALGLRRLDGWPQILLVKEKGP